MSCKKVNQKQSRAWLLGLIILADILFSWVFFYLCDMWLKDIFGPDIIEYENWFGDIDIEDTVVYRFGICSVELLITLLQAVLFVGIEVILYKKKKVPKVYNRISIVIHVLNFLCWGLFYIDWNAWVSIPEFLLPQYIVQKIMYGW